jgi:hypothetical protein
VRDNFLCSQPGDVLLFEFDGNTKFPKQAARGEDVVHEWTIFDDDIVGGQQRSGHGGQSRVFGATDTDLALEALPSLNS